MLSLAGDCNPSPTILAPMQQPGNGHNAGRTNNSFLLGAGQVGAVVPAASLALCVAGLAQHTEQGYVAAPIWVL